MSKLRAGRPSPALVISILALFVALGGSAYAATKIGTKDIKANAITTGKIKKNAVTTAKIKRDAVTGAKIKESTLGAVPSATDAVNAINFSRYFTSGLVKSSPGPDVNLGSVGPFTFTGKCKDIGGGKVESWIVLTTAATNSYVGTAEHEGFIEGSFDPGKEQLLSFKIASSNPQWSGYGSTYNSFNAASPDGSVVLDGVANNGAGVLGAPCTFEVWTLNGA